MARTNEYIKELMKIHDECLDYDLDISDYCEEICNKRTAAYDSGSKEAFRTIIPILDWLIEKAEDYKEYLEKMFPRGDEE